MTNEITEFVTTEVERLKALGWSKDDITHLIEHGDPSYCKRCQTLASMVSSNEINLNFMWEGLPDIVEDVWSKCSNHWTVAKCECVKQTQEENLKGRKSISDKENNEKWTDWYVLHKSGRGTRIKVKPTSSTVHVGAGSTSQMVNARSHSKQRKRIDDIDCIRFTRAWAKHHEYLLSISFTLDEYKEWKVRKENGPDQMSLEDFQ